jgi:hypothetical protein
LAFASKTSLPSSSLAVDVVSPLIVFDTSPLPSFGLLVHQVSTNIIMLH